MDQIVGETIANVKTGCLGGPRMPVQKLNDCSAKGLTNRRQNYMDMSGLHK